MELYSRFQKSGRARNGDKDVASTDSGTISLVTAIDSTRTIYVQRLHVSIKTDAAQTMTFQDTNASAVYVEATDSSPGANTHYDWDFGPKGKKLTLGKDLVVVLSGAGLAGSIQWETYELPM